MIKVYKPLKLVHRHDRVNAVEKFFEIRDQYKPGIQKGHVDALPESAKAKTSTAQT